ncbi:MAG TPA: hypothetical protein VGP92_09980, partial [Acidimicrobiia bacterium]|nr:hypothetical protein [Acidimicrobiia bacterium]
MRRISGGGDRFVGAVRFRVPSAGDYTVRVRNDPPRTVLIARPLTDTIKRAIGWFLLAGVGGLVFAAGVTSL